MMFGFCTQIQRHVWHQSFLGLQTKVKHKTKIQWTACLVIADGYFDRSFFWVGQPNMRTAQKYELIYVKFCIRTLNLMYMIYLWVKELVSPFDINDCTLWAKKNTCTNWERNHSCINVYGTYIFYWNRPIGNPEDIPSNKLTHSVGTLTKYNVFSPSAQILSELYYHFHFQLFTRLCKRKMESCEWHCRKLCNSPFSLSWNSPL